MLTLSTALTPGKLLLIPRSVRDLFLSSSSKAIITLQWPTSISYFVRYLIVKSAFIRLGPNEMYGCASFPYSTKRRDLAPFAFQNIGPAAAKKTAAIPGQPQRELLRASR